MRIEDILKSASVRYLRAGEDHHAREGWIQLECPFCGKGSGKHHLGVNLKGGYANCWKCGSHSLNSVFASVLDVSFREAKSLTGKVDKLPEERGKKRGTLKIPKFVEGMKPIHRKYLRNRGYDPKQVRDLWGAKGIGRATGSLSWRIFIPIRYKGKTVSWTTRSVSDSGLRYLSASEDQEEIPHKELLYGEDFCVNSCVIVEGPLDVWRIGPGAVGTCGTGYSRAQVLKMSKYPLRVIVYDSEPTAQRRAERLMDMLSGFDGETINVELESGDPGEATDEEVREIRKLAEI